MNLKKKPTIADIAREAEVSKTTVSFYLNGKTDNMSAATREKIAAVILRHNYRPSAAARMLGSDRSGLIGVLIGDITNSFANHLVKGIDLVCRERSCQLIVGNSDYDPAEEARHLERMIDMKVDGIILQPTANLLMTGNKLDAAGVPVVYIDSKIDDDHHWVVTDNYQASFTAMEACVRRGYDRFLMLTADPNVLTSRMERYQGCKNALHGKGVTLAVEQIGPATPEDYIFKLVQDYLAPGHRLLVFAPNCWLLPKVFTALAPLRAFMPGELGLLGFDNQEWCDFSYPSVSTIVQPAAREGETAARILFGAIEQQEDAQKNAVLECGIRWRQSVWEEEGTSNG